MSKARNLADLLNSSGDVKSDRLDNVPVYSDVTGSAGGLMTPAMKIKLDAIEAGATADQTKSDITGLGIADDTLSNVATLPAGVVTQLKGDTGATGATGPAGPAGAAGAAGPGSFSFSGGVLTITS